MKKTLILAFAATSFTLAGCADETPADVDTTIIEAPAAPVDPMMADSTMMGDDAMMADSTAMETAPMEGSTMEAAPTTADSAAAGM